MIPLSDANGYHQIRPYVTWTLIFFNAFIFAFQILFADTTTFFYTFGMVPSELTQGLSYRFLESPQGLLDIETPFPTWGTLISSIFIHGGFLHFGSNMLYLWIFGDNIENWLGHSKFLIVYLVFGLAGSGAHVMADANGTIPVIGASGAIAGVLGAYFVLFPRNRVNTLVMFYFITIARIPAVFVLGGWFVLQLFSGLGSLATGASSGVAYWAHVGGFVAGLLVAYLGKRFFPPSARHLGSDRSWDVIDKSR
jgi:membrane associated rhomboid family serine protease